MVTGSCGFVGGHLTDTLLTLGHRIHGVDCLDERAHPLGLPAWWPKGERVHLTVCDIAEIPPSVLRKAEVVIHLAAQVSVADSMTDPSRYMEDNSWGTAEFLCSLRDDAPNLQRLIVASSMSVYGEGGVRVTEDAPVIPMSPYGLSKYDQERLCLIWGEQYNIPTVALRFFNVYGNRQCLTNPYTGVLANFANWLLKDKAPIVYEDGGQTRDFIYVQDVVDCIVKAMSAGKSGVFNVCTGNPVTIIRAAKLLGLALGKGHIEPKVTNTVRPGDIRHCTGDPTKAAERLGFTARWPFEVGIQEYARHLK